MKNMKFITLCGALMLFAATGFSQSSEKTVITVTSDTTGLGEFIKNALPKSTTTGFTLSHFRDTTFWGEGYRTRRSSECTGPDCRELYWGKKKFSGKNFFYSRETTKYIPIVVTKTVTVEKFLEPKGLKPAKKDTVFVPMSVCCEKPKQSWREWYLMAGRRTTYHSDLLPENAYLGAGFRLHWRDTTQLGNTYVGSELSVLMAIFKKCPDGSCGTFTDKEYLQPKVRFEIFGGREFGLVPQLGKMKGFVEARYAIVQPKVIPELSPEQKDLRVLPKKSGLTVRGGVRLDVFKGVGQLQGACEYDPIAKMFGGDLRFTGSLSAIKKANDKAKAKAKIRQQKLHAKNMAQDTVDARDYLFKVQPITLDSVERILEPYFPGQSKKALELNEERMKLWDLLTINNNLRAEVKQNPHKLPELKKNRKKFDQQRRKVARLQKRVSK